MRKVAFISAGGAERIKKVMLYETDNGVFLFGYDTVVDCCGMFDERYENAKDAQARCAEEYRVKPEDWIPISDPREYCNCDYIMPVKIKGRENGRPEFDSWEICRDGKWQAFQPPYGEEVDLRTLTGNERLFVTGLMDEFDRAKKNDRETARKILSALGFDANAVRCALGR